MRPEDFRVGMTLVALRNLLYEQRMEGNNIRVAKGHLYAVTRLAAGFVSVHRKHTPCDPAEMPLFSGISDARSVLAPYFEPVIGRKDPHET